MYKLETLNDYLRKLGKIAVAFSGGVDSTFLLKAASSAVGAENVIAVTILSSVISEEERQDVFAIGEEIGVKHIVIEYDIFLINGFKENPVDRCYICKKKIFEQILSAAAKYGITTVVDGTNADDIDDYRPGMKALAELGIRSPLKECNITKAEIREMSRDFKLETWNRPSLACLASRIPYHEEITEEKLRMVEKAERYLRAYGFTQLRVRCHGDIARIELIPFEMEKIYNAEAMKEINISFKSMGFSYVTLDLGGYRTGSLNESILGGGKENE